MSFHPREAQEDQIILKMSICLILALAFGIVCSLYRHNAADYRAVAANPMSGEASFRCESPGEWNSPFTARVAWDGGAQSFSYTAPTGRPDVCSRSEIPVVPVVFPADEPIALVYAGRVLTVEDRQPDVLWCTGGNRAVCSWPCVRLPLLPAREGVPEAILATAIAPTLDDNLVLPDELEGRRSLPLFVGKTFAGPLQRIAVTLLARTGNRA